MPRIQSFSKESSAFSSKTLFVSDLGHAARFRYAHVMGLECLLVTTDSLLLEQIQSAFRANASALEMRQDSASALELVRRRHLDGIVIDCDDVVQGAELIKQVRTTCSNRDTQIIAILKGVTNAAAALDSGANFVLSKPISDTRLRSVLGIAFPKMECERRRYFRFAIDLPVRCGGANQQAVAARMKNISEGGMAIKLMEPAQMADVIPVEFDIPSLEPQPFKAKADVVWSDAFEMGLRFLHIEKQSATAFNSWLSALEAQHRFRESIDLIPKLKQ